MLDKMVKDKAPKVSQAKCLDDDAYNHSFRCMIGGPIDSFYCYARAILGGGGIVATDSKVAYEGGAHREGLMVNKRGNDSDDESGAAVKPVMLGANHRRRRERHSGVDEETSPQVGIIIGVVQLNGPSSPYY